ncbi:DMT family transporter [Puniceibacterium sediminis]|uniref:Permease of the drug/metabolite transporter (DMT) superfamily n=1 Tax=Puniceibacterium sediminis TaxID=1608407 RepID=A0A238VUT4_9RHOB|nr:DMT family transporter [Puniceibacterium sediminis]SNR37904.1 Permease of the drug/metabolite transporter (DMT) superfamily [Puniceibacterium sediminis]
MSPNVNGALLSLLSFGIYASHDVIVKTLGGTYSPFQIVFFSVLFSFPLAMILLIRDSEPGHLRPVHPWWTALRTVAAVTTGASAFYAFSNLPLAQVYAILFAAPLIITLLSIPILGERVRLRRWMAVIVGLCGVLVVLRPGMTTLAAGHMAALVAAFGSALASIIVRKIGNEERPVVLVLYPMLTNFVVMGALTAFVYVPMPLEHLALNATMALLGFTASIIIIYAYKAAEAVIVAPMQYSQILWATIFGVLLFDEIPDALTLLGAGIIIASGIYIVVREGVADTSENTPVLQNRSRFETGTIPRISTLLRLRKDRAKDPH